MTSSYEGYHASRFQYDPRRDRIWQEVCLYLVRYFPSQPRVLELGAGYCHLINNLPGARRDAVDLFPDLPRYAAPGVTPHVQSCSALPQFADGSFDVVAASNLFEHLTREDLSATLAEVRRILAPAGRLILIQPNFKYCFREYFDDYTHLQVFTDVSLCDLLEVSRYKVIDCQPRFLPFSMKSRLPKFPFLVRWYLASPLRPFAGQMLIVAEPAAA